MIIRPIMGKNNLINTKLYPYFISLFVLLLFILIVFIYKTNNIQNDVSSIPKKIWTIWHTKESEAPEMIKKCYKYMKKMCIDYELNHVNFQNYKNWVNDDRIINIIENPNIIVTAKSDLLRIYLVNKYGGIYLDSSILLLDSLDWIITKNVDLIMFKNSNHTTQNDKPVLENWFIASRPNQIFNKLVMDHYIKFLNSSNITKDFNELKNMKGIDYQRFSTHGIYHLIYFIYIYTQFRYKFDAKIEFLDIADYPYMLIHKHTEFWKLKELYTKPINDNDYSNILNSKFIKFINGARDYIKNTEPIDKSFIQRFYEKIQ